MRYRFFMRCGWVNAWVCGSCLAVLLTGCGCFSSGQKTLSDEGAVTLSNKVDATYDEMAMLTEAMLLMRLYQVEDVSLEQMISNAITGMVKATDVNQAYLQSEAEAESEEEPQEKGAAMKVSTVMADDEQLTESVGDVERLADQIGYVCLRDFDEQVPEAFGQMLMGLKEANIQALILDLRDNPGGSIEATVGVAQQVLQQGTEIGAVCGRAGTNDRQTFVTGPCEQRFEKLPLVVLVNRTCAQEAEVLAGALQVHKRALLVGEKTSGQASVQNVFPFALRTQCALRLTTGYYWTPDNLCIQGAGIVPDERVDLSSQAWEQVKRARRVEKRVLVTADVQLQRAVEILQRTMTVEKKDQEAVEGK